MTCANLPGITSPSASGNIGAEVVAKSPGDGYSLVMGTAGTHSINGALYDKMPYDIGLPR